MSLQSSIDATIPDWLQPYPYGILSDQEFTPGEHILGLLHAEAINTHNRFAGSNEFKLIIHVGGSEPVMALAEECALKFMADLLRNKQRIPLRHATHAANYLESKGVSTTLLARVFT